MFRQSINKSKTPRIGARLPNRRRAFSLLEVLILVSVIAIIGAAVGRSLQAVAATPVKNDQAFQIETQLISKMESLRATASANFAALDPSTATGLYSDTVTIANITYQRNVTVSYVDPTSAGPADTASVTTCKRVTVTCGGQTLSLFVTQGG
jgi:type II secretory pathway pseudopilin PulG